MGNAHPAGYSSTDHATISGGPSPGGHKHGATAGVGNSFSPSDGFFIMDAAKKGNLDVVRLFLKKNPALVYAVSTSQERSTAWHLAAQEGQHDVLQLLVEATRQSAVSNTFDPISKVVNAQNSIGRTALMLACKGGHQRCVQVLLENGADILPQCNAGLHCLHYSGMTSQGGPCVLEILRHSGLWGDDGPLAAASDDKDMHNYDCYDSDLPCNLGTTPLHLAAMRGNQFPLPPSAPSTLLYCPACIVQGLALVIVAAYVKAVLRQNRQHEAALQDASAQAEAQWLERGHLNLRGVARNIDSSPAGVAGSQGQAGSSSQDPAGGEEVSSEPLLLPRPPQLPNPRTAADAYNNTPYLIAISRNHDDPMLLETLNPDAPIPDLDKGREGRSAAKGKKRAHKPGLGVGAGVKSGGDKLGDGLGEEDKNQTEGKLGESGCSSSSSEAGSEEEDETTALRIRPEQLMLGPHFSITAAAARAIAVAAAAEATTAPAQHPSPSGRGGFGAVPSLLKHIIPSRSNSHAGVGQGPPAAPQGNHVHDLVSSLEHKRPPPSAETKRHPALDAMPDCFLCALTCQVLRDPVVAHDGMTYERKVIEMHFENTKTAISPVTKQKMPTTAIFPNRALKQKMPTTAIFLNWALKQAIE
eukprot:gene23128-30329_t